MERNGQWFYFEWVLGSSFTETCLLPIDNLRLQVDKKFFT